MNDDELMTAVRESFAEVRLAVPVEQTARRGRTLRGRSRAAAAAAAAAIAAVTAVTAVTVAGAPVATGPGGTTLDAWTVTKASDGTLNVTIRQLLDVAGLQRTLRADGVPARVAFQPGLPSTDPPMPPGCKDVRLSDVADDNLKEKIFGGPQATMSAFARGILVTIVVRQIPPGVGVYLAVQSGSNERTHYGWSTNLVQRTPACTG